LKPYQIDIKAKEFGISLKTACAMRCKYLIQVMGEWDDYLDMKTNVIPALTVGQAVNEYLDICLYQQRVKKGTVQKGITDRQIDAAREYPIESVVEFVRGVSLAFCHNDTRPSLSHDRKNNKARCFVCNKSFSAIDVLMERDGMSFIDAVKKLG
jgi:molybdenum cofactor biosynthesis enzyme MoaA